MEVLFEYPVLAKVGVNLFVFLLVCILKREVFVFLILLELFLCNTGTYQLSYSSEGCLFIYFFIYFILIMVA